MRICKLKITFDSRNFNFATAHHLSFEKYKQVLSKKLFHRAHSRLVRNLVAFSDVSLSLKPVNASEKTNQHHPPAVSMFWSLPEVLRNKGTWLFIFREQRDLWKKNLTFITGCYLLRIRDKNWKRLAFKQVFGCVLNSYISIVF